MAFWFDGYNLTVVSNNVHQLRHLHFSIEQILDMNVEYHFNPSESVRNLLEFNILYDEIIMLDRFGDLEQNNYDGILSNFVLSQYFNENKAFNEKVCKDYLSKLQLFTNKNAIILVQEESKYQEMIESVFKESGFKIMLRISTFEGFDRINWLLKK